MKWLHGYTNHWKFIATKTMPYGLAITYFYRSPQRHPYSKYYSIGFQLHKWFWYASLSRVMNPPTYGEEIGK